MAGSQLKRLKARLKEAGLTGQTNKKRKGKKHSRKTPNESRRADRQRLVQEIRDEFNPFDLKMTRGKRADAKSKNLTVGKPGISKQRGEERRKADWKERLARKNKVGGIIDKRFGEKNKSMTSEEKMLERFTREKLAHSSKYSLTDMDSDDDDDNDTLTHYGQTLGFKEKDHGSSDDDADEDEGFFQKKNGDDDANEAEEPGQGSKKKTKAEVMKEVIAKSKFYKHLRQEKNAKVASAVSELDDDFNDIMTDLRHTNEKSKKKEPPVKKTETDLAYDKKVLEVKMSEKAAPAERTKTLEEIAQEKKENLERLEQQRLKRMQGQVEDQEPGADDLDDDFWEGDVDAGDGEVIVAENAQNEDAETSTEENQLAGTTMIGGKILRLNTSKNLDISIICPKSLQEFEGLIESKSLDDVIVIVRTVFKKYQPKLAAGNKEKIGVFTGVLLDYLFKLADEGFEDNENKESYVHIMEFLSKLLRDLAEKYPEKMLEFYRIRLSSMQTRIEAKDFESYPKRSDLMAFTLIGRTFSTSDMYHLVVIPALIVMCESLEFLEAKNYITHLFAGIYICDLLLQYERVAKRVIPEVVSFLEKAILVLVQEPNQIPDYKSLGTDDRCPQSTKFTLAASTELPTELHPLSLSKWDDESVDQRLALLLKVICTLDRYVSIIYKECSSFIEITTPFVILLKHMLKYHALNLKVKSLLMKIENVRRIAKDERKPLLLQHHRPLAIPTFAPKFEENYNPDKKYYDPNRTRQEINKLRHQLKEERKQDMRALRREAEFEGREQVDAKKKAAAEYHAKMARIMDQVQTEEGAAKNEYEREKKKRRKI
ncbi:NOP14 [Brettanomyces bruxellensis]|uniref:DEBR0S3_16754g1_1 n=1 Tax=Dekkera bruxellensis TaxID=5007 RepID=A0A7D9CYX7_DEKBR|nr:NOP14 [Brettanomyces bruxellensis]